jgi:hypothetical protein
MRNTMNAVGSIRTLGDEELGEVSGGHGHCHRRRHGHPHEIQPAAAEPSGGAGELGGLASLLQLLTQVNMGAIIQLVFGNNNTVIAGLSQNNVSQ